MQNPNHQTNWLGVTEVLRRETYSDPNHQTNWLGVTEVLRRETYSDHNRVFHKHTNLTILASNTLLSGNKKFQ